MNRLSSALVVLFFGSLIILSSCKKDPDPEKTPEELQIEKLTNTWVPKTGINAVTVGAVDVSADWAGFVLTMGNKTYSSTGADQPNVWPANGTWDFAASGSTVDINTILRSGNGAPLEITILSVTANTLKMQFDYDTSLNGKLSGTDGTWIFDMVVQ